MEKIKKIINSIKDGDKKTKNLLKNVSISFGLKGVAIIINLLLMPLYIKFFDNNIILGIWLTISSLLNYICSFDIGIGNGLRNYLIEPLERKDKDSIKSIISTSYLSMFILGFVIIILFSLIFKIIPWNIVLNINNDINMNEIYFMLISIFIGVIIHFVLNLINSICYAMQKSFIPSLILNITNLIIIIGLYLYKYLNFNNKIIYVSILNIISITIPYLVFTIFIFSTKLKGCFISIKFFSIKYFKKIVGLGSKFLYLQLISLLYFSTNEYLINLFTAPEFVVEFQIYNKIIYAISSIFSIMLIPLWSAVKEAMIQKDENWVRKVYNKINTIWLLTIPIFLIVIAIYKYIVIVWLGKDTNFSVNYLYLFVFSIYYFEYMKFSIIQNFANGMEKIKENAIFLSIITIIKFVSIYFVYKNLTDWIYIIIINSLLLLPYIIVMEIIIKKELKLKSKEEKI